MNKHATANQLYMYDLHLVARYTVPKALGFFIVKTFIVEIKKVELRVGSVRYSKISVVDILAIKVGRSGPFLPKAHSFRSNK
jgi:hypothetical protein